MLAVQLVAECKKENIVITVWVLINTSKEIQEPAVLERTTPAVTIKAPELEWFWPRGSGTRSRQCGKVPRPHC